MQNQSGGSFFGGARFGRFGVGNPLNAPTASVETRLMGNAFVTAKTIANSSTATTGSFSDGDGVGLVTPSGNGYLYTDVKVSVKHTVAGALFSLGVSIYDEPVGVTLLNREGFENFYIPVQDQYFIYTFTSVIDLASNGIRQGTHSMYFAVKNLTAGTLMWGDATANNYFVAAVAARA